MWQAQVRVDLGAIRANVTRLREGTSAEVMAVVKADAYGHGMSPAARARRAGITAPVLAWLLAPGLELHEAVSANVDLSASDLQLLSEIVAAARRAGRPARVHLKVDTGLARGGATADDWPALCESAAKAA